MGTIDISEPQFQGLALSLGGAWITYNSENLVWLAGWQLEGSTVVGSVHSSGCLKLLVWLWDSLQVHSRKRSRCKQITRMTIFEKCGEANSVEEKEILSYSGFVL